jgi:hypothetical protein
MFKQKNINDSIHKFLKFDFDQLNNQTKSIKCMIVVRINH